VTVKGQGRDLDMFGAHYLENGWRQRLGVNGALVGNGHLGPDYKKILRQSYDKI